MALIEQIKKTIEAATGIARPDKDDLPALVKQRAPRLYRFEDDGKTPNNPAFPLVIYRNAVHRPRAFDSAAIYEALFAANGWRDSWRDGIYRFLHFHARTHEVLGNRTRDGTCAVRRRHGPDADGQGGRRHRPARRHGSPPPVGQR